MLSITVDQLINDAYFLCGLLNENTALTGQQYTQAFNILNLETETLSASGMNIPYFTTVSFNMTPGQAVYTFGNLVSSDVQTNRFVSIDYIDYVFNQIQYPVHVDSTKEWKATFRQVENLQPSPPQECFVDQTRDETVVTFYYPPDQNYLCYVRGKQVFDQFTDHDAILNLPPYYYKWFKYRLAKELALQYPGVGVWTDMHERELTVLIKNQTMNNQVNLDIKPSAYMLNNSPGSGNYLSPIFSGY